ncbi:MAG: sulfotransferase [Myxococcota bacterium]|nr:sulfotransferase [Myxococcota bacterium]
MGASRETNVIATAVRRLRLEVSRVTARLQMAARKRRNAARVFRPLFVAGAIGSGTSLLAASLGQRFAVAGVALESARAVSPSSCLWVDRLMSFDSIRAYEDALVPQANWSVAQAREDLLDLYRSSAVGDSSAEFFVDKGPNTNLVRASFLARAFPDAHFVLIFRDPVVNIEGFRRKWRTFGDDRFDESLRFWAAIHERFLEQAESFPDRCISLEYEARVEPYEEVRAARALRLGVEPSARQRPVAARDVGHGRGLRGVEGGRIKVVGDASARAYARLEEREIDRIRERLGPLHERLRASAAASGLGLARGDT